VDFVHNLDEKHNLLGSRLVNTVLTLTAWRGSPARWEDSASPSCVTEREDSWPITKEDNQPGGESDNADGIEATFSSSGPLASRQCDRPYIAT